VTPDEVRQELEVKLDHLRDELGKAVRLAVAPINQKLDGLAAEFIRMRQEAVASLDRRMALTEARLDGEVQLCRECRQERDHVFGEHTHEAAAQLKAVTSRLDAVEREQVRHAVYWRIVQVAQAVVTSGVGLYFIQAALRHMFGN
jgi:hypothetical protein